MSLGDSLHLAALLAFQPCFSRLRSLHKKNYDWTELQAQFNPLALTGRLAHRESPMANEPVIAFGNQFRFMKLNLMES